MRSANGKGELWCPKKQHESRGKEARNHRRGGRCCGKHCAIRAIGAAIPTVAGVMSLSVKEWMQYTYT